MRSFALAALFVASAVAQAQQLDPNVQREIQQILSHPLFAEPYLCSEHAVGELPYPGDDLGQDCMVTALDEKQTNQFMRLYRTDGVTNEDWYGWNKPVHSPCDCEVVKVMVNPLENRPGKPDKSRASGILLKGEGGTMVVLAHLQSISVKEGDQIEAGGVIGAVGNNGYARAPHVHIGAWRGKQALQIRWDQRAMKTR